jgi:hypothetical protein
MNYYNLAQKFGVETDDRNLVWRQMTEIWCGDMTEIWFGDK